MNCTKCGTDDPRQPATFGTAVQVLHCRACGTPHCPDPDALRVCVLYTAPPDARAKSAHPDPGVLLFYSSNWEDAVQAALTHLPAGARIHDVISTLGPLLLVPRKALQGFVTSRPAA